MTYTQQAIEEAIKGGWKPQQDLCPTEFIWKEPMKIVVRDRLVSIQFPTKIEGALKTNILIHVSDVLLDPDFWRCLGVGIGLSSNTAYCSNCGINKDWQGKGTEPQFYHLMHDFITHIAQGNDYESFFKSLMEKKV